ncbi:VOC family protein [bacterium]|nr:VOC family protein [bacterium]MCI0566296.1 VOC family protein [bacterium]MCI0680206.1 VOC family protein [bacterium]
MNSVVHFEIPFDDQKRAEKFYKKLFGWNLVSVPDMSYTIAQTAETSKAGMPKKRGAINGGMFKRGGKASRTPVIVIDVPNIKNHLARIEKAGGKITMPMYPVGDMGLYAQVKDTEGNIIGVWQTLKKK